MTQKSLMHKIYSASSSMSFNLDRKKSNLKSSERVI